jgi:hypothetical protein
MYYLLREELEKKGNHGRRDYVPMDFDYDAPHAQGNLSKHEFPKYEPVFSDLILTKSSSLVDFVVDLGAIGGYGMIVSSSVKEIFSSYALPPHRFYPLRLIDRKKGPTENFYFWMQVLFTENYAWIDYKKSSFCTWNYIEDTSRDIVIPNDIELERSLDAVFFGSDEEKLSYRKIYLNESFKKNNYDLFDLPRIVSYPIISEKLKARLIDEKVLGLEPFREADIALS